MRAVDILVLYSYSVPVLQCSRSCGEGVSLLSQPKVSSTNGMDGKVVWRSRCKKAYPSLKLTSANIRQKALRTWPASASIRFATNLNCSLSGTTAKGGTCINRHRMFGIDCDDGAAAIVLH